MAFDQQITYRVNLDDSNFSARLSQLRSTMDQTLGGGYAGGTGYNPAAMMQMAGGGNTGMMMGGLADFGSQIRPITYSAPGYAMSPHFGMAQIQQTLAQAGLGAMGPVGAGIYSAGQAASGFMRGGFSGAMAGGGLVPQNISGYEYFMNSSRAFGDRMGDVAAVGLGTTGSMMMQLGAMGLGGRIGAGMFTAGTLGATVGGLLGGAALAAIPAAAVGTVMDVYGENRSFQETLAASSFRFISGAGKDVDPITGRGLSRRARVETATAIQSMEMADTRFGSREYQQILEGGAQMDLFSGSGDAEQFRTKFKGLVDTLKTVTATLHTSLKEGMEVIRGMRDIGVTDPGQIAGMVLGSEVAGRVSGRTGMEMMAIGQQGAELFRGTGIKMALGFQLEQQNVEFVRQGLNQGTISREMVAQAGGELGMAHQLTASTLGAFQSTLGRGMMMAAYDPATGGVDMNRLLGGGDAMQMVQRAGNLNARDLINLQAQQANIISKFTPEQARMMDIQQSTGMAQILSKQYGVGGENAFRYAEQMRGKSEAEITADLAFINQDPDKLRAEREKAMQSVAQQTQIEDERNRFWGVGKRIMNAVRSSAVISGPAGFLRDIQAGISGASESASQYLMGISSVNYDQLNAVNTILKNKKELPGLIQGNAPTLPERLFQGITGNEGASVFAGQAAGFDSARGAMTVTSGGATAYAFKTSQEAAAFANAHHMSLTGLGTADVSVSGKNQSMYLAATTADLTDATNYNHSQTITDTDREAAKKIAIDQGALERFTGQAYGGKVRSLEETVQGLYGAKSTYKDLNGEQKFYVQRFLDAAGPYGKKALNEANKKEEDQNNLSSGTARAGKAAASDIGAAISAVNRISTMEGGNVTFPFMAKTPEESLSLLEAGMKDADDATRAKAVMMLTQHGATPEEAERRVKQAVSAGGKKDLSALHDRLTNDLTAAHKSGSALLGGGADAASSTAALSDVSKDAMSKIMDMSKALETQLNLLKNLQQQVVDASMKYQVQH